MLRPAKTAALATVRYSAQVAELLAMAPALPAAPSPAAARACRGGRRHAGSGRVHHGRRQGRLQVRMLRFMKIVTRIGVGWHEVAWIARAGAGAGYNPCYNLGGA